ncbi:putative ethylene-responsive transcription factor ERF113-like [Cocos nucifera]|uniref:Putative ethylene-responsive transcription factor ERF113-like n=1 Tax=Cocos nucifera TaxID=13894 RepID=A0A8K0MXZ9_COCNU|nr:putative ethylene-responsive transcription factor ERF113-like [Cocos nucifera]
MFSRYTAARADQDASAMVSALAHVISSSSSGVGVGVGRSESMVIQSEMNPAMAVPESGSMERELSQPTEEQGMD